MGTTIRELTQLCLLLLSYLANKSGGVSDGGCPCDGWLATGGNCYYFSRELLHRAAARTYCLARGGDLASIHSSWQNDFINVRMRPFSAKSHYWIGLERTGSGWQWLDGSDLDWTNWGPAGEPTESGCIKMSHETAMWEIQTTRCSTSLRYFACSAVQYGSRKCNLDCTHCAYNETKSHSDAQAACQAQQGQLVRYTSSPLHPGLEQVLGDNTGIHFWMSPPEGFSGTCGVTSLDKDTSKWVYEGRDCTTSQFNYVCSFLPPTATTTTTTSSAITDGNPVSPKLITSTATAEFKNPDAANGGSLPTAVLAVIAVMAVLLVGILVAVSIFVWRHKSRRNEVDARNQIHDKEEKVETPYQEIPEPADPNDIHTSGLKLDETLDISQDKLTDAPFYVSIVKVSE